MNQKGKARVRGTPARRAPARGSSGAPADRLPPHSLLALWRPIGREFARRGSRWGLPDNVAFALVHLHNHPENAEPARLASALCQPRQTMTFILDQLEQRKLARRATHPRDRRRRLVRMTPAGRALAARIYNDLVDFEASALASFTPSEAAVLRSHLGRYADALARYNAQDQAR